MQTLKLPRNVQATDSATIRKWHVQPGQQFEAGSELLELEAREALVSVTAPIAGVLSEQLAGVGQTVEVGGDLARISAEDASAVSTEPQVESESRIVSDQHAEVGGVEPILMPLAGNTMEEGTVLEWRVQEGDMIELGQILCEIETDKATMEYESPIAGRLARIVAPLNEPVPVKELIAVVADSDAAADAFLANQGSAVASSPAASPQKTSTANSTQATQALDRAPAVQDENGRVKASPAARKLAAERGLSLASVGAGSGPGGRILSGDLSHATSAAKLAAPVSAEGRRSPMSKMRRAIATNLQHSKQTIPHFYLRLTIDAGPMYSFYKQEKPQAQCSLNDLVVLGVGRAMREFPAVRSQIDGDEIVEFPHANIGIAVGVDEGLVVPVVMNVDTLSLAQLSQESKRVVEAGRKGVLENVGKGNFTISNLGMFDVEEFSAIINPPESGILAVSALRETVIVKKGAMRPGRVMTMTLSADHRIVDGLLAAQFMRRLKTILENPADELS